MDITMIREATSDVQLWEDLSHVDELEGGEDFMEDFAQLIMAESEGIDFCLVPIMWHVGGKKDGYWQAEDVMMIQTTLVMQSKDKRGKMFDNTFIGNRLDSRDWEDSKFTIEKEGDSIVW